MKSVSVYLRVGESVCLYFCISVCLCVCVAVSLCHIVPFGKFHRIGGAPPETFPNVKYDAPEEMGGDRKCFDSPIGK